MTELRTSRRTFNHVSPPRFALLTPVIWLLLLVTLGMLGLGIFQQFRPSNQQITAVVDGELPLNITQDTVDAVIAEKPAYLPEQVVIGVTTQPKGSDGVQQLMDEKGADLVLSVDPETGWSSLKPEDYDPDQNAWADYQAYPYDKYGISVNSAGDLSGMTDYVKEDLELSIVKNTIMGHGPKTIQAIATQLEKLHEFEKVDSYQWAWWALIPLLIALMLTMRHVPKNRAYQNSYYRYAKASGMLNMVVLNLDLIEAALAIDSASPQAAPRQLKDIDEQIGEAQKLQEAIQQASTSQGKMLKSQAQQNLADLEKLVKNIVHTYNEIAIKTGIITPFENRYSDIYGITGDHTGQYPAVWNQPAPAASWEKFIVVSVLAFIPVLAISFNLQTALYETVAQRFATYTHPITQVKYEGNPEVLQDFLDTSTRYFKDSATQSKQDPVGAALGFYPSEGYKNDFNPDNLTNFFKEDATLLVVPINKTITEIFPNTPKTDQAQISYDVSSAEYLQFLQQVKAQLNSDFIDPDTQEIKDNVIVLPAVLDDNEKIRSYDYLPPLLGQTKDFGNHYYDTQFLLMRNGGDEIILFRSNGMYVLEDYQEMFNRTMSTGLTSHMINMGFILFAFFEVLMLIIWLVLRNRNGAIIAGIKAQKHYSNLTNQAREKLNTLALQLDDAVLNSLVLPADAVPQLADSSTTIGNDARLAEYESALAEAWYHLQVLEAVPLRLRATSALQNEAEQLTQEIDRLVAWEEKLAGKEKRS